MKNKDEIKLTLWLIGTAVVSILMMIFSVLVVNAQAPETEPILIFSEPIPAEQMMKHRTQSYSTSEKVAYAIEETEIVEEEAPLLDFPVLEEIPLSPEYQLLTRRICKEYNVNYSLFLAICESESSFNVECVAGDSGRSIGPMQINKPNWNRYGLDASKTEDNFEIGIRMIKELVDKYMEFDAIVMAYKGGESFANKWISEGRRLECCDTLKERAIYWEGICE